MNNTGAERLNRVIGPVYRQLREQIAKYGDPTPSRREYDRDLTIQEYNNWIDREMEKWHKKIKALRSIEEKRKQAEEDKSILGNPQAGNVIDHW